MKLHTENISGNLHEAANYINKKGWADYVIHMSCRSYATQVVFKMPKELVWKIRKEDRCYTGDIHHDDVVK